MVAKGLGALVPSSVIWMSSWADQAGVNWYSRPSRAPNLGPLALSVVFTVADSDFTLYLFTERPVMNCRFFQGLAMKRSPASWMLVRLCFRPAALAVPGKFW